MTSNSAPTPVHSPEPDVIIFGSGLVGSMHATVLAGDGARVLMRLMHEADLVPPLGLDDPAIRSWVVSPPKLARLLRWSGRETPEPIGRLVCEGLHCMKERLARDNPTWLRRSSTTWRRCRSPEGYCAYRPHGDPPPIASPPSRPEPR